MLPPADLRLAQLEDAQLKSLSSAYAGLYALPAAASRAGKVRTVALTASAGQ